MYGYFCLAILRRSAAVNTLLPVWLTNSCATSTIIWWYFFLSLIGSICPTTSCIGSLTMAGLRSTSFMVTLAESFSKVNFRLIVMAQSISNVCYLTFYFFMLLYIRLLYMSRKKLLLGNLLIKGSIDRLDLSGIPSMLGLFFSNLTWSTLFSRWLSVDQILGIPWNSFTWGWPTRFTLKRLQRDST